MISWGASARGSRVWKRVEAKKNSEGGCQWSAREAVDVTQQREEAEGGASGGVGGGKRGSPPTRPSAAGRAAPPEGKQSYKAS